MPVLPRIPRDKVSKFVLRVFDRCTRLVRRFLAAFSQRPFRAANSAYFKESLFPHDISLTHHFQAVCTLTRPVVFMLLSLALLVGTYLLLVSSINGRVNDTI